MIAACLLAGWLLAQEPQDPLRRIRELIEQGSYADAANAVEGLPEPARTREAAYLRYQAYDLDGAAAAAHRALESDGGNASLWILLGDVHALRADIEGAAARYKSAQDLASRDPALVRALAERDRYVRAEREYRERVRSRVRLASIAAGLWVLLAASTAVLAFRRAAGGAS